MVGWPLNTSLTTYCKEFRSKILLTLILREKHGFKITPKIILSFTGTVPLSVTVIYRWRTIKKGLCKGWPLPPTRSDRLIEVKTITVIKEKHIRDFDKWLLNTAPPNADWTIISLIIFAEKRLLLSLILFLYNRLTSKCHSMALV